MLSLDRSRFDYERNHCFNSPAYLYAIVSVLFVAVTYVGANFNSKYRGSVLRRREVVKAPRIEMRSSSLEVGMGRVLLLS